MLEFLTVLSIVTLAIVSPGPDFAVVTKNALVYSRRAGIFTAMGIASGTLIHASYCIFGLAIIISKSLLLFSVIKYLGAAYLIYTGIKSILAKKNTNLAIVAEKSKATLTAIQAWRQGFLCNVLNPKCILFFMALFTLIIKPTTPFVLQVIYGLLNPILGMLWFSGLSILITHRNVKTRLGKIQHYVVKVMGGFLVAFGIRIATMSHSII